MVLARIPLGKLHRERPAVRADEPVLVALDRSLGGIELGDEVDDHARDQVCRQSVQVDLDGVGSAVAAPVVVELVLDLLVLAVDRRGQDRTHPLVLGERHVRALVEREARVGVRVRVPADVGVLVVEHDVVALVSQTMPSAETGHAGSQNRDPPPHRVQDARTAGRRQSPAWCSETILVQGPGERRIPGYPVSQSTGRKGEARVKVVIFCGGMGVRMGEATQTIPKPMINVGSRPILWHIMKWYASWGHTDFILCLGYRADSIKQYFLSYNEALANDFVLSKGGREIELLHRDGNGRDVKDWRITFVDTGIPSVVGQRLKAIQPYVADEPVFLATYGDGLTDAPLDDMIATFAESGKTALFLSVRPRVEYHVVKAGPDGIVRSVEHLPRSDVWINGGFFAFRQGIFDVIEPGEDLVNEPFARLIEREELLAYRYEGFWQPMDTIKDKQKLDTLVETGAAPWQRRVSASAVSS